MVGLVMLKKSVYWPVLYENGLRAVCVRITEIESKYIIYLLIDGVPDHCRPWRLFIKGVDVLP